MPAPANDISVGMDFGCLTVTGRDGKKWKCRCVCTNVRSVTRHLLKFKQHKHCTCSRVSGKRMRSYPEYGVWCWMKDRCLNENATKYKDYGGRGISICSRWLNSFFLFLEDMGSRPTPKHTIERNNVNGNYEPSNCRWATNSEQQSNKTNNRRIEYNGEVKTLHQWAMIIGMKPMTLARRLNEGWSTEKAFTKPVQKWGR